MKQDNLYMNYIVFYVYQTMNIFLILLNMNRILSIGYVYSTSDSLYNKYNLNGDNELDHNSSTTFQSNHEEEFPELPQDLDDVINFGAYNTTLQPNQEDESVVIPQGFMNKTGSGALNTIFKIVQALKSIEKPQDSESMLGYDTLQTASEFFQQKTFENMLEDSINNSASDTIQSTSETAQSNIFSDIPQDFHNMVESFSFNTTSASYQKKGNEIMLDDFTNKFSPNVKENTSESSQNKESESTSEDFSIDSLYDANKSESKKNKACTCMLKCYCNEIESNVNTGENNAPRDFYENIVSMTTDLQTENNISVKQEIIKKLEQMFEMNQKNNPFCYEADVNASYQPLGFNIVREFYKIQFDYYKKYFTLKDLYSELKKNSHEAPEDKKYNEKLTEICDAIGDIEIRCFKTVELLKKLKESKK